MYLITAYFDGESNKKLQHYIDIVAEKTSNSFMIDNNVPPHLTISSIESRDENMVRQAFCNLSDNTPGTIYIASVGMLLPYVVYAAPVLNEYLQGLSENIYDSYKNITDIKISRFYRPFSWMPHITIGKKLSDNQMLAALEIMQKSFVPFEANIVKIGLSKVNPYKDWEVKLL